MDEGFTEALVADATLEVALDAAAWRWVDYSREPDAAEWAYPVAGRAGAVRRSVRLESGQKGRVMRFITRQRVFLVYCAAWAPALLIAKIVWG